jgi:hypothetical protein
LKNQIVIAFRGARRGFSADRVIADPGLNIDFISRCRIAGLTSPIAELNLKLLNLRKAGLLKGEARSERTSFRDEESYRFASEVAARHLEKRQYTTLDRVICDPVLAAEFDAIASDIAPGFTSLQYRWAALNLRKVRSLKPELFSHVVRPTRTILGRIESIRVAELPTSQGLYVFYGPSDTLYVGEGSNIQRRVGKHLDHSDNKNLARWFWSNGFREVHLEIQILDDATPTKIRKALEGELISSRHPVFNVQQVRQES